MDRSTSRRGIGALAFLAFLAFLLSVPAHAADWSVVLNGKAVHVDAAKDWNEANWGLGVEREFGSESRWVKVALGNGFRDSQDEMSYMAGGGIKRRFRPVARASGFYVDVGAIAFLMTRQDVDGNRPFPGLLPAMTVGTRNVALNVTYLPGSLADQATNVSRVDPDVDGIIFLQLKFDARMFGFGGTRGRFALASAE